MKKILDWLRNSNKANILSAVIAFMITLLFFVDYNWLDGIGSQIFFFVVLAIWLLNFFVIFMFAGVLLYWAMVKISISLTFLIFLSYTYCDIAIRTESADAALQVIIFFGAVYILYEFIHVVIELFKKTYEMSEISNESQSFRRIMVFLFAVSTLVVISYFYQVISAIFQGLCIY